MLEGQAREALVDGADAGDAAFAWLSAADAAEHTERYSPRLVTLGGVNDKTGLPTLRRTRYSCCGAHTGSHALPCTCCRARQHPSRGDFDKFGGSVGTSLDGDARRTLIYQPMP